MKLQDVPNLGRYFQSSGNVCFRKYNCDAHYFTKNTVSLQGAKLPFKTVKGVLNDKKNSPLYSYYLYPIASSPIAVKK